MPNDASFEPRREINQIMRLFNAFRTVDVDMPMQTAVVFLLIAYNEGCALTEIQAKLGMASSTASRNVAALSHQHRLGKPGLGLVVNKEDPADRRRKTHHLTAQGRALLNQILSTVRS